MRFTTLLLALLVFSPVASPAFAGRLPANPLLRTVSCDPNEVIDKQSMCVRKCADTQRRCGDSYANSKEACEAKVSECVKACGC